MVREVIEPPSVKRVLLSERRQELLLQIEFENKFSKKRSLKCSQRRMSNKTGLSAREWQELCKLNKVSNKGSIPEMQERLRIKGCCLDDIVAAIAKAKKQLEVHRTKRSRKRKIGKGEMSAQIERPPPLASESRAGDVSPGSHTSSDG